MAIFDATGADEDIRFLYGTDLIDFSVETQATPNTYEWRTSGGNIVTALGNFTYDSAGNLTGGAVTAIDINLSNDSDNDIAITSIDNADILALIDGHINFWNEIFIGDDQFLLPTGQTSFFAGDDPTTRDINTQDAGDDSLR